MKLYIPKGSVESLHFILEMFIETHETSEAHTDDVDIARNLLSKVTKHMED